MKNEFKKIPEPLQKQILYRLGCGFAVMLVAVALIFSEMDWLSIVSFLVITIFFLISAFLLFRCAVIGNYVVIGGECLDVVLTVVKRRTKMITLRTDDNRKIQVMIKNRLRKIPIGSRIIVYVASNMPVYERGDAHFLNSYLAIETKNNK